MSVILVSLIAYGSVFGGGLVLGYIRGRHTGETDTDIEMFPGIDRGAWTAGAGDDAPAPAVLPNPR